MALTQVNGNQISSSTIALITQLSFLNTNSVFQLPSGTQAQRPSSVAYGAMRFNTSQDKVEVYVTNSDGQGADGWSLVGAGGPHLGTKDTSYIRTNSTSIDENITIGATANGGDQFARGLVAGPIAIASGYTLTIEDGASFYIIGDESSNYAYENVNVYSVLDNVGGRFDVSAVRESITSYRLADGDANVNINNSSSNIYWVTNLTSNFGINLTNLPVSNIATGGVDANRAFGFTIMYYNGSNRYRPSGNILINGSSVATATWYGGSPPATLTASRFVNVGVTLIRVTEYTDNFGTTSTSWKAYLQFNEFA